MKFKFAAIFLLFFCHSAFPAPFVSEADPEINEAVVYVKGYDYGAAVEKIVIHCGKFFRQDQVNNEDFEVSRLVFPKITNAAISRGDVESEQFEAFISDKKGNPVTEKSQFITLKMKNHPEEENLNPFADFALSSNFKPFYAWKIENDRLDIKINRTGSMVCPEIAVFKTSSTDYVFERQVQDKKGNTETKSEKITMNYAWFIPEHRENKIPLIIWFHGLNESGTNPYAPLAGIKASALASEKIQSHFKNGAAILVPQSPEGWLKAEDTGAFGIHYWAPVDKKATAMVIKKTVRKPFDRLQNALNKLVTATDEKAESTEQEEIRTTENNEKPFAAVSYFTKPVLKLIDEFLIDHPEIDRKRIYIGGCSAGGYMTMNMLIQRSELFAAAFPICEYYLDSKITDDQIQKLAEKPLWFVNAKNDGTVNPENNTNPTLRRLKEAGAQNLHYSIFDDVHDTSGLFFMESDDDEDEENKKIQPKPYQYKGHYSWIYVLNDEAKDDEESSLNLFDWLSRQ